jgi:hypothetical protein
MLEQTEVSLFSGPSGKMMKNKQKISIEKAGGVFLSFR